jgi:hypothetical protein
MALRIFCSRAPLKANKMNWLNAEAVECSFK